MTLFLCALFWVFFFSPFITYSEGGRGGCGQNPFFLRTIKYVYTIFFSKELNIGDLKIKGEGCQPLGLEFHPLSTAVQTFGGTRLLQFSMLMCTLDSEL